MATIFCDVEINYFFISSTCEASPPPTGYPWINRFNVRYILDQT